MSGKGMLALARHPAWPGLEAVVAHDLEGSLGRHVHGRLVVGLGLSGTRRLLAAAGEWLVAPGRVWIIPAGTPHAFAPCPGSGQAYLALAVDTDLLPATPAWPRLEPPRLSRDARAASLLPGLVRALAGEGGDTGGLLARLIGVLGLRATAAPAPHPATVRARALIDAAPDRVPDLAGLARLAGVGPYYLERVFTRDVGVSVGEYVLARRVRLAWERIRAGDALSEAALAAGFCDQSHLTRHFRRRMGVSPGRCRVG